MVPLQLGLYKHAGYDTGALRRFIALTADFLVAETQGYLRTGAPLMAFFKASVDCRRSFSSALNSASSFWRMAVEEGGAVDIYGY